MPMRSSYWHFFVFSCMDIQTCYKIGYIAKNHGLKGEVMAVFSEDFDKSMDTVFLEINHSLVPHFIKQLSGTSAKAVIAFEDVTSIEKASALKGCSIYLPKSVRPKLKRGDFYDDELIGFAVEDTTLGNLGKVSEIIQSGSNKLLSVMHDANKKEVLIPVHSPFILSIRKSEKKITVELPDGFSEI